MTPEHADGIFCRIQAAVGTPTRFRIVPDIDAIPRGSYEHISEEIVITESVLLCSEDEVAWVIGHEYSHRLNTIQDIEIVRQNMSGNVTPKSIETELRADREGTEFAIKAGFKASGGIEHLKRIEQVFPEVQTEHAHTNGYPTSGERIQNISRFFSLREDQD